MSLSFLLQLFWKQQFFSEIVPDLVTKFNKTPQGHSVMHTYNVYLINCLLQMRGSTSWEQCLTSWNLYQDKFYWNSFHWYRILLSFYILGIYWAYVCMLVWLQLHPLLMESLNSDEAGLSLSTLTGLQAIMTVTPSSISDHVPTLIPRLLALVTRSDSMVKQTHNILYSIYMFL